MLQLVDEELDQLFVLGWEASENILRDDDGLLYSDRLSIRHDLLDDLDGTADGSVDLENDLANGLDSSCD